jgi:DNA uptake protein ComE-like DNA-binding protein
MKLTSRIKRWIWPFFTLKKAEQRGILLLSFIILVIIIAKNSLAWLIPYEDPGDPHFEARVSTFIKAQKHYADSMRIVQLQNTGKLDSLYASVILKPFRINPNSAGKEDWLRIGLTMKQTQTILNYRKKGGNFHSAADFAKMYCISDAEFRILKPYLILKPEKEFGKRSPGPDPKTPEKAFQHVELNSADTADIVDKLLLPHWLASRILKYRDLLGGFYRPSQLFEVYGLDSIKMLTCMDFIEVDTLYMRKLSINKANFKTLLRHPYLSYEQTKKIIELRKKGPIKTNRELVKRKILTENQLKKIKPYLTISSEDYPGR